MAVFNKLDVNAKRSLGNALVESSDWHSRFDAISFLAKPDIMNEQVTQQFIDILYIEPEYYIRNSIIKALNQPEKFSGNQEVLNALEQVGYSDQNNNVRGEALLARITLENEPETVSDNVFSAIASNEEDYQVYGLRAFEEILILTKPDELEINSDYYNKTKYLLEALKDSEYNGMPPRLIEMVNEIYERYF